MAANIQLVDCNDNCALLGGLMESSVENPPDGLNGQCIVHYTGKDNKNIMVVQLVNGIRHGEAILLHDGVPVIILEYQNGNLTGPFKKMDTYGVVMLRGQLQDGKETGLFEECDKDGNVTWIGYYNNGNRGWQVVKDSIKQYYEKKREMNGEYYILNSNNCCIQTRYFVNGVATRTLKQFGDYGMIEYNDNGNKAYEGDYQGTGETGFYREGHGKEYASNGKVVVYSGDWKNGKREGFGTEYRLLKPVYTGDWKNGKRDGKGSEMDLNGNVIRSGKWVNGIHESEIPQTLEPCKPQPIQSPVQYQCVYSPQPTLDKAQTHIQNLNLPQAQMAMQKVTGPYHSHPPESRIVVNSNEGDNIPSFIMAPHSYDCDALVEIKFGNNCYTDAQSFVVFGFSHLKTISIGDDCFTSDEHDCIFRVASCMSLERIEIGEYSFPFYGGFELEMLDSLRELYVGTCAFKYCHSAVFNSIVL